MREVFICDAARTAIGRYAGALAKVRTEMSLHVLAYNLKRVMQIFGIAGTMRAIRMVAA